MNKWEKASNFLSVELNKLMILHFAEERQLLQELVEQATQMPSAEELKKEISKCSTQSQMIDVLNKFVACYYGEMKWSDDE